MADYSQYTPANGYAGFNYSNLQDPIKRRQAAAAALLQMAGANPTNPQFVQNGMGTFYAGPSGAVTGLTKLAAGLLSRNAADSANNDQAALDKTSNDALAYNLDPSNSPGARLARAMQVQSEDDAQLAREGRRGDYGQPPGSVDTSAPPVDTSAQPSPVAPGNVPPIPQNAQLPVQQVTPAVKQKIAAALSPKGPANVPPPGGKPSLSQIAAAQLSGGDQNVVNPVVNPDDPLSDSGSFSELGSKLWHGIKGLYGFNGSPAAAQPQPVPPQGAPVVPPQGAPVAPPQGAAPIVPAPQQRPPVPVPPPQAPVAPPQQAAAPVVPPVQPQVAPTLDPITGYMVGQNGQAVGYNGNSGPQGDSRSMADQAAANAPMSQGDQLKQILAIGQTGPLGQQIATSQLNQMFGSKNGRFTTTVHADPVNGGFVKVVTDSQTGNTSVTPIGNPTGQTLVTGQTTDANGNRLNLHKDGSTTPVLDNAGRPVMDPGVLKTNKESDSKQAENQRTIRDGIAAIDNQLANDNRMLELYNQTLTGPVIGGKLPAWTKNRQELQALAGNSAFSGVRDAVDGAGGGSQRFTQAELQQFSNHNLSLDTDPQVASNLIAARTATLQRKKANLMAQLEGTPDSNTSSGASAVPTRGQSVKASSYGF